MIATVFALEFESAGFRALQQRQLCVSIWTLGVMGHHSGPALEKLIEKTPPSTVISAGFSGALQPDLPVGTVVLGSNFSDAALCAALQVPHGMRVGQIITVDRIIETASEKKTLGTATGALACDLESSHLKAVCDRHSVPLISIRVISDALAEDIPVPSNVLMDPVTGRSEPQALFRYLFRHPSKAAGFARLVRDARSAQGALAAALRQVLPSLLRQSQAGNTAVR